jgi:hypothetical protein
VLRAALTCAVEDETIARNPVTAVKMTKRREPRQRRKHQAWTVEDARWFLESASHAREALYAAFVLVLVLGLRRGEVLGLAWDQVDLDDAELYVGEQLQRVRHQLARREVKTETSEAPLPLPDLCVTALKARRKQQDADRSRAGDGWIDTGLVFTTRHGTPIEPRNFGRSFDRCIIAARVPGITVHGTRKTFASLLAALDFHPPGSRCASCGTARSPSQWRSTPKPHPRPPVMRSASSAELALRPSTAALRSIRSLPAAAGSAGRWRPCGSSRFKRWQERYLIEVITGVPPLQPAGHGAPA